MTAQSFADILDGLRAGKVIPYLGPGVLQLAGDDCTVPSSPALLAAQLTAKVKVPHKLRNNLTGAAQYIENFKHRSTLTKMLIAAFAPSMAPTELHRFLAAQPSLPLLVNAWYDDLPQKALASRSQWGLVQGVSQTEHFGRWVNYFHPDGSPVPDAMPSIVTEDACDFRTPARGSRGMDDAAVSADRIGGPGGELPGVGQRLCRGSDRDRHSNADPAAGAAAARRPQLPVPGLSLLRTA